MLATGRRYSGKGRQGNASALTANMSSKARRNAPPVQGPRRDRVISFGLQIGQWRCPRLPSCEWHPSDAEMGLLPGSGGPAFHPIRWRTPFVCRIGAPVQPGTGAFERNTKPIAEALRRPTFHAARPLSQGGITECNQAACCFQLVGVSPTNASAFAYRATAHRSRTLRHH